MQIRRFAEQILFGSSWHDKLLSLDRYEDTVPGEAMTTPPVPGRPHELGLDAWQHRQRVRFADVRRFNSDKERGLVLHFFANHELLALELMALALLKFPDAPDRFRRGLVRTLLDEQDHVRLYRRRMEEIGVEFGEIPVSDFFWKSIGSMDSPLDFVSRLSLTLEQANLDYAVHYANVYRQLGDIPTADILGRVYRDEIGHVRHGLLWFNRWRDSSLTEWEAYKGALSMPLTPGRAKGIGFNRDARYLAGFSTDFIDELEVYNQSRGRCPAVYWFNPLCETEVARNDDRSIKSPRLPRMLAVDLATLPMFLCAPDDVVLLNRRPKASFLRKLQQLNLVVPEFAEDGDTADLSGTNIGRRKVSDLRPWGWSPQTARFLAPLAVNLSGGGNSAGLWSEGLRPLYSKAWSVDLLREFLEVNHEVDDRLCSEDVVGRPCADMIAAQTALGRLHDMGFTQVVAKGVYGSSGRAQIHLVVPRLRPDQQRGLERMLAQHGAVVVEPWLNRVVDLSVLLNIGANGSSRFLGWTRFLADKRGQYRGSFVSRQVNGLDVDTRRFIYGDGCPTRELNRFAEGLVAFVGSHMATAGFRGPAGIDMLVYCDTSGLRLKPVVEINPRFTMGHVALGLGRRVNSARTALWLLISEREAKAKGFANLGALADYMEDRQPPTTTVDGQQLDSGVVCITDAHRARAFAAFLLVGDSLATCKSYFQPVQGASWDWVDLC